MSLYVSFDCESCENENCTGKGLKPTVYKCDGYKHKQTNADRIRAMSDEELANFLDQVEMGDIDYSKTFCDLCDGFYDCHDDCLLGWLRAEATI